MTQPPENRLAEIKKDNPAMMLGETMMGKLEEAQNHILNELDQLIGQIEQIKSEIRSRTLLVQQAVREHFELSAEAIAFKHKVENRLKELQNGAPKKAPTQAG